MKFLVKFSEYFLEEPSLRAFIFPTDTVKYVRATITAHMHYTLSIFLIAFIAVMLTRADMLPAFFAFPLALLLSIQAITAGLMMISLTVWGATQLCRIVVRLLQRNSVIHEVSHNTLSAAHETPHEENETVSGLHEPVSTS